MAHALVPALRESGPNDRKLAAALSPLIGDGDVSMLPRLERALLYGKGAQAAFAAKGDKLPTKALRQHLYWLPATEAAKAARGWLDFDDLILRARDLLSDPTVAQWVLFKLDGGIDHILIDEAQDTSPEQWQVIAKAGAGVHRWSRARARRSEQSLSSATESSRSIHSRAPICAASTPSRRSSTRALRPSVSACNAWN
jgi:ATP-dependent helicase/nuclease subunit A